MHVAALWWTCVALLTLQAVVADGATGTVEVGGLFGSTLNFDDTPYTTGFTLGIFSEAQVSLPRTNAAHFQYASSLSLNLAYDTGSGNVDQDGFPTDFSDREWYENMQTPAQFVGRAFKDFPETKADTLVFDLQSANRWTPKGVALQMSFQADAGTQFLAAVDYVLAKTTLVSMIIVASPDSLLASTIVLIDDVISELARVGYQVARQETMEVPVQHKTAYVVLNDELDSTALGDVDLVLIPTWLQVHALDCVFSPNTAVLFLSSVPFSRTLAQVDQFTCSGTSTFADQMSSSLASYASPFQKALRTSPISFQLTFLRLALNGNVNAGTACAQHYPLFLGYVDALVFLQSALRSSTGQQFWGQSYFLGDSWQVGPFSESCSPNAGDDDLLPCGMSSGVHTVYFLNVTAGKESGSALGTRDSTQLLSHMFSFPWLQPTAQMGDLTAPRLHVLVDQETFPRSASVTQFSQLLIHPVPRDYFAASAGVRGTIADSTHGSVFVALGLAVSDATLSSNLQSVFINPLSDGYLSLANALYLTPTVEQEVAVLAQTIEALYRGYPVVVVGTGEEALAATGTALTANGVTGPISHLSPEACADRKAVSTNVSVYLVVGDPAAEPTFGECLRGLAAAKPALLFLTMRVIESNYDFFADTKAWPASDSQRVFFATNLASWVNESSTTRFDSQFRSLYVNKSQRTASSMKTFSALTLLSTLARRTNAIVAPMDILDEVYNSKQTINGVDLSFFVRVDADKTLSAPATQWNNGIDSLTVWERSAFFSLDSDTAAASDCQTTVGVPSVYVPLGTEPGGEDATRAPESTKAPNEPAQKKRGMSSGAIAAVSVVAVLVALAAVLLLIFCCCFYAGNTRNNTYAPKGGQGPVAFAFTDIESSTALWSTVPSAMSTAVADHHKIIRRLIVKHKCYEVKTIGDSFMIASSQPFSIVKLARDLQLQLHEHDWGTSVISEVYAALAKEPTTEHTNDFRGLRVRVGIHVGEVNVQFDEVTKGYDYYGDTVNTAARTESLASGGQVIMTEFVHRALDESEQNSITVRPLGPQNLRGVPKPVDMLELVALSDRYFSELRAKASTVVGTEATAEEDDLEALLRPEGSNTAAAKETSDVLGIHFAPYSTRAQIKMLRKSLKQFGISPPKRSHFPDDETYAAQLLALAVRRTTAIVEFRRLPDNEALRTYFESTPPAAHSASNPLAGANDGYVAVPVDEHDAEPSPDKSSNPPRVTENRRPRSTHVANNIVFTDVDMEEMKDASLELPPLSPERLKEQFGFKNGLPSVPFEDALKCFNVGSCGMLFRLFDPTTNRWAFYNDTADFSMVVTCTLGRRSRVAALGQTVSTFDEGTRRQTCQLTIAPLTTELFVEGKMHGFKFQYTAVPM